MAAIAVGDVVRLNNSCPKMTVHFECSTKFVECIWFDDNCRVYKDIFNREILFKLPVT